MLPYINTYNYIFKIFFLHTENFNIFKFDFDLCEVKDVSDEYVITEKGLIDKDRFYIPKSRIIRTVCMVWNNKKRCKSIQKELVQTVTIQII